MATVIAKSTFRSPHGMVAKGAPYDSSDAVVKAYPGEFDTPGDYVVRTKVPTSTADLGDRSMSTRKRRKRKSEKATADEVRDTTYSCEDCDFTTTSERGIAIHRGATH